MKEIGILDPDGKYTNPLTGKKYSDTYYQLSSVDPGWRNFPMYKEAKKILKLIENHRVCVIESGTGTGKTVILPKLALHTLNYKGKVVMTIPKKAATLSSAAFAAAAMDVKLGQEVGFQFKDAKIETKEGDETVFSESKSNKTRLLFSTEGSVVRQLNNDPSLKEYDIVVIDEAHERSIEIDRLLVLMREAMLINNKLKLIVTSATLPQGLFENYFREKGLSVGELQLPGVPNKPVELIYSPRDIEIKNREAETLKIYEQEIVGKDKKGDTLIFTVALNKAKKMCQEITSKNKDILCLELSAASVEKNEALQETYSKQTIDDLKAKGLVKNNIESKVMIATKIYESSVTLKPLIYVIDNGLNKEQKYDPERMEEQLNDEEISQAQATQRKGRAGRNYAGFCYRAYSKKQYDKMLKNPIVPIKKSDITEMILSLLDRYDINNLTDMLNFLRLFIERPPKIFVQSALRTLHLLNLIDKISADGAITELGRTVLVINSKVQNLFASVAFYYAKIYDCAKEMSMIIAAMSAIKNIDDLFVEAKDKKDKENLKSRMASFKVPEGDAFSVYEIITSFLKAEWREKKDIQIWCRRNYLNYKRLNKITDNAVQIFRKTPQVKGEKEFDIPNIKDRISYCLLKGYLTNLALNTNKESKIRGKNVALYKNFFPIQTSSAPINEFSYVNKANYIIYSTLFSMNNQKSLVLVTKINKNIVELLNNFEKAYLKIDA